MRDNLYKALGKSLSGKLSTYLVQFLTLACYARLFSTEEFGIIASIQVFVIFFQLISDIGIGPAIVNESHFNCKQRNGVFSITFIIGFTISILFYLFSYYLNNFYGGYEYQEISLFVCVLIFTNTLSIVPKTSLTKDAKFIAIGLIEIAAEIVAFAIVILLYTYNYGVLALASRSASQGIVKFVLTYHLSKNTKLGRPKFGSELYHFKKILQFSMYQFGFNMVNYFSRNLDNILVAKYFGMSIVGVYDKSYQLMRYPLLMSTQAMIPAIQPILTKYRTSNKLIVKEHNLLTKRLLTFSLLISSFIYFNSNDIVLFMFGVQWVEVVPIIEIFSFMIPIQAVLSTSGSFFQVMNKPRYLFYIGISSAAVTISAIVIGINLGDIFHLACCIVIAYSINFLQIYRVLFKNCFHVSQRDFYKGLLKTTSYTSLPMILYGLTNLKLKDFLIFNPFINLVISSICLIVILLIFRRLIIDDLELKNNS